MQKIQVIELFDAQLSELGEIADSFSTGGIYNPAPFIGWLDHCIRLAKEHQPGLQADLSLLKADLLTYLPAHDRMEADTSRLARKLKRRHIWECMNQALSCVRKRLQPAHALIDESSALCRKLLAVSVSKGYVAAKNMQIPELIRIIQADAELMPALTNVIGTVGYHNTTIILARTLCEILPQEQEGEHTFEQNNI